jgi:hypothetical protein
MINSEPFKKLSPNAVWVLVQFLNQKKMFTREYFDHDIPIKNREEISLTYSQVKGKMGNNRFSNAIRELKENGFLNLIKPGGLFRQRNIYALSNDWKFNDPKLCQIANQERRKKDYSRQFENFGGALDKNKSQHPF